MVDDPYLELIAPRTSPAALAWLREVLERTRETGGASGGSSRAWMGAYAGASRRVGRTALELAPDERESLRSRGLELPGALALDELARAVLLRAALEACSPEQHAPLLRDTYQRGDSRERRALLRALALLPGAERFAPLAAEACRSHVQDVFEALACENDYPARHLPEAAFNQLVIKALFTDVPLKRIRGLAGRLSPELVRMARDYANERRAAGRPVSNDLRWLSEEATPEKTA